MRRREKAASVGHEPDGDGVTKDEGDKSESERERGGREREKRK